jgi:hypothetical protein
MPRDVPWQCFDSLAELKRLAIRERAVTPINPERDHVTQYLYAQLSISGYSAHLLLLDDAQETLCRRERSIEGL